MPREGIRFLFPSGRHCRKGFRQGLYSWRRYTGTTVPVLSLLIVSDNELVSLFFKPSLNAELLHIRRLAETSRRARKKQTLFSIVPRSLGSSTAACWPLYNIARTYNKERGYSMSYGGKCGDRTR
jgi:hypothetical protein